MTAKALVRLDAARADVDHVIAHYIETASPSVALAFITALEEAYLHVSSYPASGSPRIGRRMRLPGLRSWPIIGFPYVAFYVEHDDHIDVWRILHTSRDIPASLTDNLED